MSEGASTAPIACTLAPGAYETRLAWIAALNAKALAGARRDGLTLTLEYRREAASDVAALVLREQACCAFLRFVLADEGERLVLTITAPEAARDAAEPLFEHFQAIPSPTRRAGATVKT